MSRETVHGSASRGCRALADAQRDKVEAFALVALIPLIPALLWALSIAAAVLG